MVLQKRVMFMSVPSANGGVTKVCSDFYAFQVQTMVLQRLAQASECSKRKPCSYKRRVPVSERSRCKRCSCKGLFKRCSYTGLFKFLSVAGASNGFAKPC